MEERTITMTEIKSCTTWSKKDNSPRGCKTISNTEIKPGDYVVYNNRFTEVIDDPAEEIEEQENTTEEENTMKKTLKLEKRGCEFFANDPDIAGSDVGNYRVVCDGIQGKDGKTYFLEFTHWKRYTWRHYSKQGGKLLKKPVWELVNINALGLGTQFDTETGSYRNLDLEKMISDKHYCYTISDILKAVNEISKDTYTSVIFI